MVVIVHIELDARPQEAVEAQTGRGSASACTNTGVPKVSHKAHRGPGRLCNALNAVAKALHVRHGQTTQAPDQVLRHADVVVGADCLPLGVIETREEAIARIEAHLHGRAWDRTPEPQTPPPHDPHELG